jgi:phage tail protein X
MAIAVALTNALQIEAKKAMEETVTLAVGDANRGLAEMHRQLTRAETLLSGQAGRCGTIAAGPRGMTHGILTCAMQASQESFAYGANVVTDVADAVGGAWLRLSQEGARMCGRVASVLDAMVAAAPAL